MGSKFSVDECTSADNQRVRDCCHLEGETPIEIRIAYQQPRPPVHPSNFDPGPNRQAAHPSNFDPGNRHGAPGFSPGTFRNYHDQLSPNTDAEKPPMPRGTERLRLPPPASSARNQPRTPASQASTSDHRDFDAETFAAPPDSERSEIGAGATPGRMQQPAALQMLQAAGADDDYFPEIVRVPRQGASNTFREALPTVPATPKTPEPSARTAVALTPQE